MDVASILSSVAPAADTSAIALPTRKKASKPKDSKRRGVFSLLKTEGRPPLVGSVAGGNRGGFHARLSDLRAKPWVWTPFTSSARKDGLRLRHWARGGSGLPDYPFARFNKHADVISYTDEEYVSVLQSEGWSREDTDRLFRAAHDFDLNWFVIADRFRSVKPRTMEELKERYYSAALAVLQFRRGGPVSDEHPLHARAYQADYEKRRKALLDELWQTSAADVEEERKLTESLDEIDSQLRALAREAKTAGEQLKADAAAAAAAAASAPAAASIGRGGSGGSEDGAPPPPTHARASYRNREPDRAGPYLRSSLLNLQLGPSGLPLGPRMVNKVRLVLNALGVPDRPLPTRAVAEALLQLQEDVVRLLTLQKRVIAAEMALPARPRQLPGPFSSGSSKSGGSRRGTKRKGGSTGKPAAKRSRSGRSGRSKKSKKR